MQGFDLIPVVIGLFGIGEVFITAQHQTHIVFEGKLPSFLNMLPRGKILSRGIWASVRGSVLGFFLGVLPGMIPALTAYLSYDVEKRISKNPNEFGNGAIEGVAGPESANNATAMGGFIPLFSLGIPTSPAIAIMLGVLMINGVQPGPMFYEQNAVLAWTIIASMLIANTVLLVLNLPLVSFWAQLSKVPYKILGPIILCVCFIGAFSTRSSMFDVGVALIFGLLSFYMRLFKWPASPLILGFLLGPMLEQSSRQSLEVSNSLSSFIQRPILLFFIACTFILISIMIYFKNRSSKVSNLIKESTNEV